MRVLSILFSGALLVAGALGSPKSSIDQFDVHFAKSLSASPIKLSESSYKTLTTAPRNYSAAVLLTALETRFSCQLCREFQPEYSLLAKSWTQGDKAGKSRIVFGTLDFVDGRDIFVSLGLQTAPVLLLFQPTEGPHAVASPEPLRYDFTNGPPTAEQVHAWVSRHLVGRPHPSVRRPINWMKWVVTITLLLGGGSALVTASRYIIPVLQNRSVWASISLISILLFTSGHMFNHIRKVPYVAGDGRGGISYFAGSFQSQYGMETQVVAAIYGLLALCTISLALRVPRIADARSQKVAVFAWGGILFVLYSFLLSVFRIKNGGYPYSLPPFM